MDKEKEELLNVGMGILKHADASKLESVDVNATNYTDGTKRVTIELVYPEKAKDDNICNAYIRGGKMFFEYADGSVATLDDSGIHLADEDEKKRVI